MRIGAKIRLMDQKGEGKLLRIDRDFAWVEVDGFEYKIKHNEFVYVNGEVDEQSKVVGDPIDQILMDAPKRRSKETKTGDTIYVLGVREVDLHVHELIDRYSHLSNGEIVQMQLAHCVYHLEDAIRKKESNIIFIHGVGTGVLKQEILSIIDHYPGLKAFNASYKRYGMGATEVELY